MRTAVTKLRKRRAREKRGSGGFTLLELMIVIAVIVILATLAAGRFEKSLDLARRAAQKHDLAVMNKAIQQYTEDKGQPPSSLDDLHTAGYIGAIPVDPVTHQQDWATDPCDELFSADQTSDQGICGVHVSTDRDSSTDNQADSSY